jgi:8-oxo-dGTP pyrophosphatase MutT (NUDIX family)
MNSLFAPRFQQAAAIPLCRTESRDIRVCLIRRHEMTTWGIPKGFLDPGDTPADAALREAYEEAGLAGRLIGDAIGTYSYRKRGSRYIVAVFLMEVLQEEATWPEQWLRAREWFGLDDGMSLLSGHPVSPLLDAVRAQLSDGRF